MIGTSAALAQPPAHVDAGELGQHQVEQHEVRARLVERLERRRRRRSRRTTSKPSRSSPMRSASTKDSSSSTSSTSGRTSVPAARACPSASPAVEGEHERERGALALAGLHLDAPAVVLGDVPRDREAEPGAAGAGAPCPGRRGRSARRSGRGPSRGCRSPCRSPRRAPCAARWDRAGSPSPRDLGSTSPPAVSSLIVAEQRHRPALGGVGDAVLQQRAERRDELAAVAEDDDARARARRRRARRRAGRPSTRIRSIASAMTRTTGTSSRAASPRSRVARGRAGRR